MDDKNVRSITLVGQGMPLLLDGSMIVGYVYGVPLLVERFQTPSWFNGTILISAYVLLLIAVYTIRELDSVHDHGSDFVSEGSIRRIAERPLSQIQRLSSSSER